MEQGSAQKSAEDANASLGLQKLNVSGSMYNRASKSLVSIARCLWLGTNRNELS